MLFSMKKRVYLDYAAATPMRKEAVRAMLPWAGTHFANPSSLYIEADEARRGLSESRARIARVLGVRASDVTFVGSSTEANNLAIFGVARQVSRPGTILTLPIEHPSILEPLRALSKEGWKVVKLPVTKEGMFEPHVLRNALTKNVRLVAFAWANPDIGVVQDLNEIAKVIREARKKNPALAWHVDASQVVGVLPVDVGALGANLFTVSSGKAYGPRGIAALVVRGTKLEPLIYGGGQEQGRRSGTEAVMLAVGMAEALERASKERAGESARLTKLRDELIEKVLATIPDAKLTGHLTERLPNHASFVFKNIDGEELVVRLDARGFAVGTGSACASTKTEISEALKGIKVPRAYIHGSLRVTMGRGTTRADIVRFVKTLKDTVEEIRDYQVQLRT
jgi:cysteine desulfurase